MHHLTAPPSPHPFMPTHTPTYPFSPLPPTQCKVNIVSHVYMNPGLKPSCILCILYDNFFPQYSKIIASNQTCNLLIVNVASYVHLNPDEKPSCILCSLSTHFSNKSSTLLLPTKSHLAIPFETQCRIDTTPHVYLNPGQKPFCILCILYDGFFSTNSKIIAINTEIHLRQVATYKSRLAGGRLVVTVFMQKSSKWVFFWLNIRLSVEFTTQ